MTDAALDVLAFIVLGFAESFNTTENEEGPNGEGSSTAVLLQVLKKIIDNAANKTIEILIFAFIFPILIHQSSWQSKWLSSRWL
jgi:hypothetical protein